MRLENSFTSGRRFVRWLAPLALALTAAACVPGARQDTLAPEGPIAQRIDALFNPIFWIAAGIFVLVEGLLIIFMVKFRHRPGAQPRQIHGNTGMEIGWTLAPALLLAIIAVPTVLTIFSLAAKPEGNPMTVKVVGHQWWWEYEYPADGVVTANELHIPTGRPVFLELTSVDVIHSYWVPKLAGKQDVVPGRVNTMAIQADKPGEYLGQCVEYCGLSHANMRLRVYAHTPQEFSQWVLGQRKAAEAPTDERAARGKELFETGQCAGCHTVAGTKGVGKIGPNLTHLASRNTIAGAMFPRDDEHLRRWLRNPPGMKPGSKMPNLHLSEADIDSLVAYLATLK